MSSRHARHQASADSDPRKRPGADGADFLAEDAEKWGRLDAAVTPTGSTDLLSSIPTETGSIRAIAPGDRTAADGGPTAQWIYDEVEDDTVDADRRSYTDQVDDEPSDPVASTQDGHGAWNRLISPSTQPDNQAGSGSVVLRVLSRVLVAVAVPALLVGVAVRLVASPAFLWIEYHRPGFPADSYGFDTQQRMSLGSQGVDYILNWAPSSFLGDIRASNGLAWFSEEEISHMTDVKLVMQVGLWAAAVVVLLALLMVVLRRRHDATGLIRAAVGGAWVSIAAMVVLAVVALVSWQWFFAAFHGLFFTEGSWTFNQSDTLIRLYPTQFWVDAAATVAVITVAGCAAVILGGRRALRAA